MQGAGGGGGFEWVGWLAGWPRLASLAVFGSNELVETHNVHEFDAPVRYNADDSTDVFHMATNCRAQ